MKRYFLIGTTLLIVFYVYAVLIGRIEFCQDGIRPRQLLSVLANAGIFWQTLVTFCYAFFEEFVFRFLAVFLIVERTYGAIYVDHATNDDERYGEHKPSKRFDLYIRIIVYGLLSSFVFGLSHYGPCGFVEDVITLQGVLGLVLYGCFILALWGNFSMRSMGNALLCVSIVHGLYNFSVEILFKAGIIIV